MGAGHSHAHADEAAPLSAADRAQQKRALRWLIAVLIPLFIWTIVAMIWLWPKNTESFIRQDTAVAAVPGVTVVKGAISKVTATSCEGQPGSVPGGNEKCIKIQVKLSEGPDKGTTQEFNINHAVAASGVDVGDEVRTYRIPLEGSSGVAYQFIDFERTTPLVFFAILFVLVVVAVARFRGLFSLIGLGFAFFVLVEFMMPNLIQGKDPLLIGLVGSAAIMFVVLYTAHGFTVRTTTALAGTLFGLSLTAGIGYWASKWAHLTGVSSEDHFSLAASAPSLRLSSVAICAVIVAGMGVLNDVTITQASAVWELAPNERDPRTLYKRAMRIGRDHIASTVYTIAFAAAGAALPVLLLIAVYHRPLGDVLVGEEFAGEIVRTLVGSIGLVLAVPVTTALGVLLVTTGRAPAQSTLPTTTDDKSAAGSPSSGSPTGGGRFAATTASGSTMTGSEDVLDTEDHRPSKRGSRMDDSAYQRPNEG